ncbi:hypothetical protein IOC61_12415 [Halomonas sp. KAO]|uniref:hypothetical protein n=1 Tax=Halomonas sp. KAO TaxID=2783858 RepID=UPI00189EDCF7|nr:hypothetical protein [Halomonas sp. KAO]MBF7054108.1 hypothetical protein [Halomonas sp. KAO]
MDKERLERYLYGNVASVFWSAVLLIGGVIFVIYYALIGYMPDFDLKSSVTITAAASVTSIVIIIMMLIMMVFAGSFWRGVWEFLGDNSELKRYWLEDSASSGFRNLLIWFSIPLFTVYASLGLSLFLGSWCWMLTLGLVALIYLLYLCLYSGFGLVKGGKEFVFLVAATLCSAVFIFFPLYLVFRLSVVEFESISDVSWFLGFLSAMFIIFINTASASPQGASSPYAKEFVLGLMAVVMIFISFGRFDRIPYSVMEIYKFGNIEASELVLEREGCELFKSLEINVLDKDGGLCVVKDVLILSRLGREAYLEVDKDDLESLKLTLSSSSIASWTLRESQGDES